MVNYNFNWDVEPDSEEFLSWPPGKKIAYQKASWRAKPLLKEGLKYKMVCDYLIEGRGHCPRWLRPGQEWCKKHAT